MGFDTKHTGILEALKSVYKVDDTPKPRTIAESHEAANELLDIVREMKQLADRALRLVRGTSEEGRAKAYWYPHIVMALDHDHGYMGQQTTISDAAEALMQEGGEEDYDDEDEGEWGPPKRHGGFDGEMHRESVRKIRGVLALPYLKEATSNIDTFNVGDDIEISANGKIICDARVYDTDDTFAYAVTRHIDGLRGNAHFLEIPLEPLDMTEGDGFEGFEGDEGDGSYPAYDFLQDKIYIELQSPADIEMFRVNVPQAKRDKVAEIIADTDI